MTEVFAGIVGGLGLFLLGMWFLTENLKKLASRRLRTVAHRWTSKRSKALLWGIFAGGITQSMSALTFIVVSILRSRLITLDGALAMILGGGMGVTALVMIVTFDIKTIALYVLGVACAVVVSERMSAYRPIAASFLGGAMIILGLVILKEAAAPLAGQPWFRGLVEQTGNSLLLAFAVAAVLTIIVQSSGAVSVFGISLAEVGVVSVDQAIMMIYGSFVGSSVILYALSASLTGRSRQVVMYMVILNFLICAIVVPLLYCEIYFGIPSMKAVILATGLDLDQQLALVYVISAVFPIPFMLAGLELSANLLERLWPDSALDDLARTQFLHDHASVDVDTSLVLVDLEQRRVFAMLSQYFEVVRQKGNLGPMRSASRTVLGEIGHFLSELQAYHPLQSAESRNARVTRQKLLFWLEDAMAAMCGALLEVVGRPSLQRFGEGICEGVDTACMAMIEAMEIDDEASWEMARKLTGDRHEVMRAIRAEYLESNPPLMKPELLNVLLITNAVEEIFFLMSKLEADLNPFPRVREGQGRPP